MNTIAIEILHQVGGEPFQAKKKFFTGDGAF